ncbi:sterile alpha motif domain-containing protein 9-like [Conger conger]|uniref:sterile alpha motif domain-containing protein 9-like n=1 Tax=Conger conger TaxID=82655 RepID=UPI002A5A8839|nr:sterile alpha motif domain-containing protein 9-like [Conger conger]
MNSPEQRPSKIEEWSKEHVCRWLKDDLKIYYKYANALYEKGVSGAELLHFEKEHLLELGIKHGPAVKLMGKLQEHKKQSDLSIQSQSVRAAASSNMKTVEDHNISRKGHKSKAQKKSKKKYENEKKSAADVTNAGSQDIDDKDQDKKEDMALVQQACETDETESPCTQTVLQRSIDHPPEMDENTNRAPRQSSSFYPFDKHHVHHIYTQHSILPPETGPGNLIDPVHEYKYMGRTDDIDTIKRKFNNEVFRFAAGCMNSRTNGTIHCGVADDSKEMQFSHGEIIGIEVDKKNVIIDHFNHGFKAYFEEMAEDAKMCIRQPRFVDVMCTDSTSSNRYVIEVDVVPSHSVTQGKDYFIQSLSEEKGWKKGQHSLFVRDGASTKDIMKIGNPRELKIALQKLNENTKVLDSRREQIERLPIPKRDSNQGEKLKDLLTCGGGSLDYYENFVIITNQSHPEQLKHLQFLSKLKIFCVLDFDPDSEVKGLCRFYRETRHANLHFPAQYQEDREIVIKNLNLDKQTSWVFCNGRQDLDIETCKPMNHSDWLRTRAKEVQDTVSFLCKPQVLQNGRCLVIFLLLSNVETMIDPVFETFISFYKNLEGVHNIVSIFTAENTFQTWKNFTEYRCGIDITRQCIYELDLSEVNGTIMKMGPHNQRSGRFLPSTGSSSVCLEQKDEDIMTALNILCENECENIYDESTEEFSEFRITTEETFYRGGNAQWWNFYFSDKPKAKDFIKRDKYNKLKNMIQTVRTKDPTSPCVMLNLFHHPGCGGTTLAMHVMWNLRKEFRCAILKDNTIAKSEVALQVRHLMKCGKTDSSFQTPVLLLVDDSEETENTQELQNCIRRAVDEKNSIPLVIILNCVRSQNPKERYKFSLVESNYITTELSKNEQDLFEEKLQELKENHKKPENFYSFMIMKSNFSKEYTDKVVSNTLKDLDVGSKQAEMLSFLALLNSFVAHSSISLSVCEDFLGIKYTLTSRETVENRMHPYSTLLIRFKPEGVGTYSTIRILHQHIATQCLEELGKHYKLSKSEIVINLLHNDLFFRTEMGKDILMDSIHSMLITRQRKKEGDEKDTLFSPLIEQIQAENPNQIQTIFEIASSRFEKLAAIPQALARHLYLIEKDFTKAYVWANKAKNITENPYTVDTIGQISKSELKYKFEMEKTQKKDTTPGHLKVYIDLASKATQAFQMAQCLAKTDEVPEFEGCIKKQRSYNISGYVGEIDTAMMVFEILCSLPFFEESDQISRKYMQSFLNGKRPIRNILSHDYKSNNDFADVLENYEHFLTDLKPRVKEIFDFFEMYFTYFKDRNVEQEKHSINRKRISEHFKRYLSLFCQSTEERYMERENKPKLSLNLEIQERRLFLEVNRADSFPGLLQYLEDSDEKDIEKITECYTFINDNSMAINTKDKTNYILANIILNLTVPKSKFVRSRKDLTSLLKEILQDVGTQHRYPEPYYLSLLLLWPEKNMIDANITVYVNSIRKSSRKQLSHLFRKRNTIAHFYLGKSEGLQRLVPKPELDNSIPNVRQRNALWQSADIFKGELIKKRLLRVNGMIENGEAYINYGKLKIPVRPAYLGGVRSGYSTENVSFYVGFAIDGPLAYDIQYETYSETTREDLDQHV